MTPASATPSITPPAGFGGAFHEIVVELAGAEQALGFRRAQLRGIALGIGVACVDAAAQLTGERVLRLRIQPMALGESLDQRGADKARDAADGAGRQVAAQHQRQMPGAHFRRVLDDLVERLPADLGGGV